MRFEIELTRRMREELTRVRSFDRARILDTLERKLAIDADVPTRHRKHLEGLDEVPFETEGDLWELRIGDWRLFYDVDPACHRVHGRALCYKPPHATTAQALAYSAASF